MRISRDMSALLTNVYAAVAEPAAWQPLVTRIARALGAHSCQIGVWSAVPGRSEKIACTANYTPALRAAYAQHHFRNDPWLTWVRRIVPGSLVTADVVSIEPGFIDSAIYNDYCRHLGIYYVTGAGILKRRDGSVANIGVHRERSAGPISEREERRLAMLVPHLAQALSLRDTLASLRMERGALLHGLEALNLGAIILDGAGRVLFADSAGEAILREQAELSVRNGRLRLRGVRDDGLLTRLIDDAAGATVRGRPGGQLSVRVAAERRLSIRVCPLPEAVAALHGPSAAAIVFLRYPPAKPLTLHRSLAHLYGLTPAEARLAEALANGHSLAEYAALAGVSINTVKTLCKRLYAKTGHHTRGAFIRDVLGNPLVGAKAGDGLTH